MVLGESVYAITDRGNMFAIDANTAVEQWMTPNIRRYVAGNDQRLYCLDPRGDLVVLDRATGSMVGTIAAGQLDVPILNTQTDRIILASSSGLVQCFRESSRPWPTVHYLIKAPPRLSKPARTESTTPAEEKSEAPPKTENDPFGAPAADPFGGAAPANPAPPASDPFG